MPEKATNMARVFSFLSNLTGILLGFLVCVIFGYYMFGLHETRLWFSNIGQVEREISLRTESGLYYSYFKQLLREPTWSSAFQNLLSDPLTEAPSRINVLQRMNIYQECLLALVYSAVKTVATIEPILFYVYTCFAFSGFAVSCVFFLACMVSGHFLFGLLTAAWTFSDIDDATRVFFTVNLRENFALPFFWLENALVVGFLLDDFHHQKSRRFKPLLVFSTFLFSLFWQFNQFILLLQNLSLIFVAFVFPRETGCVVQIFGHQLLAFIFLVFSQFFQSMLVGSLFLWLNLVSIVALTFWPPNSNWKRSVFMFFSILSVSFSFSAGIKWLLNIEADSHIWSFVKSKLGLPLGQIPFETALYVCHDAFSFIDSGFFQRCSLFGMFPLYCCSCLVIMALSLKKFFFSSKETTFDPSFFNPAVVFVCIQSVLTGIMAILTLRMKYVWFPQVAVLAAQFLKIGDKFIGKYPKFGIILAISYLALSKQYGIYQQQMTNEQEFYDPDTVALMNWISAETPENAIFAGSMQLMAGVKACTSRPIANHPHFEDKSLRQRTERIYQIYSMYSIKTVFDTICSENINYVILEDSICLAGRKNGCSTNEIVDFAHSRKDFLSKDRFCQAVKTQTVAIKKHFQLVFENRTFRVYRVNCK